MSWGVLFGRLGLPPYALFAHSRDAFGQEVRRNKHDAEIASECVATRSRARSGDTARAAIGSTERAVRIGLMADQPMDSVRSSATSSPWRWVAVFSKILFK